MRVYLAFLRAIQTELEIERFLAYGMVEKFVTIFFDHSLDLFWHMIGIYASTCFCAEPVLSIVSP